MTINLNRLTAIIGLGVLIAGCAKNDEGTDTQVAESPPAEAAQPAPTLSPEVTVTAETFGCLENMTKVRHFFVDNLLGNLGATVEVAQSTTGGTYPPGSVVQLVPSEVMVKHQPGWNAGTRDWEFFELDVSETGSSIRNRGFADVVNRFGGNCFACHIKARPEFDLICELDHGCDSIPITREAIAKIQSEDPRCGTG